MATELVNRDTEQSESGPEDAASTLRSTVISAGQTIKSDAVQIAEPIREHIEEVARQEKALGADKLQVLAHAIQGAAAGLEGDMPGLARQMREAGSWVDRSAGHVREQKFEELFGSISDFARKNPAVAFAVAAVSGLALARFLKSTKTTSM